MYRKPALNHEDVEVILAAAKAEALKNDWKVTIAVVDDGGHLMGLLRLDGSPPFSVETASEKARSSALGRRESKQFEDVIGGGRTAFLSVPLKGMLEGGVPVIVGDQVIAAVGVSGVKSAQDAQIARAGISAFRPGA